MAWTGEHSAFAVETGFGGGLQTGESIIATKGAYRAHLILQRNDAAPARIFILLQYRFLSEEVFLSHSEQHRLLLY